MNSQHGDAPLVSYQSSRVASIALALTDGASGDESSLPESDKIVVVAAGLSQRVVSAACIDASGRFGVERVAVGGNSDAIASASEPR